jgi:hypothetical protein
MAKSLIKHCNSNLDMKVGKKIKISHEIIILSHLFDQLPSI